MFLFYQAIFLPMSLHKKGLSEEAARIGEDGKLQTVDFLVNVLVRALLIKNTSNTKNTSDFVN